MKRFVQALKDIRTEMQFLIENMHAQEDLAQNPILARACARSFQVIGEAAKKIPDTVKEQHADIPWKAMAGMRDIIVHEYDEIDLEQVWTTITRDIPDTLPKLERIIQEEG